MQKKKVKKIEKKSSGLWFQYRRLIGEIKPQWVLIENVANLLNIGLAEVLKDLDSLGYDAEWEVISARAIGADHLRKRVWIVAYRKLTYSDSQGFWPTFATEKEKQEWWSTTTARFRNWWKDKPEICRTNDGLSGKLEQFRREQVAMSGNAVVPFIPQIIGERIKSEHERINGQ